MAMVSAGRILMIARGAWDNATTYQMLDIVTGSNNTAYLAKQASVNVDPVSDTTQTYWQPFGSSLAADGTTIVDNSGTISVPIDGASIYIDTNDGEIKAALSTLADVDITNIGNGKVLAWNTTSQKWEAVAISSSFSGLTDVNFTNLQNGQVPKYNSTSQKWENASDAGGLVPHLIIISETGSVVTATKGATVITATETSTGHFECDVPSFGTWVIDAVLGGDDAQVSVNVDTVKIYTIDDSHFHADITVTYPTGAQVSCSKTGETTQYATGSPYTFTVHSAGTWTITSTYNGVTVTEDVVITTSGQTESVNMVSKTITVDIYSAASDTVSFTDATGAKTATTNSSGVASGVSIDYSLYEPIVFTSSVAKDPSNLSADYSKTITLDENTTEIAVMPEARSKMLYWWGYQSESLEVASATNGWTQQSGYSTEAPTYNTNNVFMQGAGGKYQSLATKNTVNTASIHMIGSTTVANTGTFFGLIAKSYSGGLNISAVTATNNISHLNGTVQSAVATYVMATSNSGSNNPNLTMYALWYE